MGEDIRKFLRPLLKFVRQITPRIVHVKAKKQLAVEMPAKNDQFEKVKRNVLEMNSAPQLPNIAVETTMKMFMRTLLSLRMEVQPRYIQGTISCGGSQSRNISQANGCTYNAHYSRNDLE